MNCAVLVLTGTLPKHAQSKLFLSESDCEFETFLMLKRVIKYNKL